MNNINEFDTFVNINEDLKKHSSWVCWKSRDKNGKKEKVPIDPQSGRPAATNDPCSWATFLRAVEYCKREKDIDGIGFVLSRRDPYCGIDIDNCRDPQTGALKPYAQDIIDTLQSYTEVSPSGKGVHIIIEAKLLKNTVTSEPKIEIYSENRFFTFTGNVLNGYDKVQKRQTELEEILNKYFRKPSTDDRISPATIERNDPADSVDDESVLRRAMDAKNGDRFKRLWSGDLSSHNGDRSSGDMALCTMLAFWTKNPDQIDRIFRKSGLMRPKWDERLTVAGDTYGKTTIKKAIECNQESGAESEQSELCDENNPVPLTQAPVLSEKALHGFAGQFVKLATKNSEADPAAVLLTFLVRFGVEVGPRIGFMVGDTKHYARLFTVIVGETSKARKGTSAGAIERLFAFSAVRTSPGPLSSGEGLIAAVQDSNENDQYETNRHLFVLDQEFASALSCTRREGNTLSTTMRAAWDNGDLDPLTKQSKISATNAHIGIVSHITLNELSAKLRSTEAFNGFANRILWTYASRKKKVPLPPPMPDHELKALQNTLKSTLEKVAVFDTIEFSPEAEKLWVKIYDDLSESLPGFVGSVTSRSEAQVLRIAMIYSLLDGSNLIEVCHLEAALAVWKYCEDSARLIFGDRENNSILQRIVDFLKTGPKTRTEIHNLFNKHIKARDLDASLNELIRSRRISIDKIETGGAPKTIFKLIS